MSHVYPLYVFFSYNLSCVYPFDAIVTTREREAERDQVTKGLGREEMAWYRETDGGGRERHGRYRGMSLGEKRGSRTSENRKVGERIGSLSNR